MIAGKWQRANGRRPAWCGQWTAPADTAAGAWRFRAVGAESRVEYELPFEILGNNPLPPADTLSGGQVEPVAGPPDTPFRFTIEGFQTNEPVAYWVTTRNHDLVYDNEGNLVLIDQQTEADSTGLARWTWEAPRRMLPGEYNMVVEGRLSTLSTDPVRIPFTITDPGNSTPDGATPPPVDPIAGGPGTTFSFYAEGYNSGELIDIYFISPDGSTLGRNDEGYRIVDETASRQGIGRWQWMAPAGIVQGEWTLVARGRDSRNLNTISFQIYNEVAPELPYGVTPASGPPGTTFTFYGEGFHFDRNVAYWLTAPDGTRIRPRNSENAEADEIGADSNGRVEITWTSPPDAQQGIWQMTLRTTDPQRVDEDITYIIQFTIE
ncbi:MAG: hypothetical protein HC876_08990 [Chloroflexaceae bacterium]|nr:hypothetical protein [Chloroflexaceae bacterium]